MKKENIFMKKLLLSTIFCFIAIFVYADVDYADIIPKANSPTIFNIIDLLNSKGIENASSISYSRGLWHVKLGKSNEIQYAINDKLELFDVGPIEKDDSMRISYSDMKKIIAKAGNTFEHARNMLACSIERTKNTWKVCLFVDNVIWTFTYNLDGKKMLGLEFQNIKKDV